MCNISDLYHLRLLRKWIKTINWRNAIGQIVTQTYIAALATYYPVVLKVKVQIGIFGCTGIMGHDTTIFCDRDTLIRRPEIM